MICYAAYTLHLKKINQGNFQLSTLNFQLLSQLSILNFQFSRIRYLSIMNDDNKIILYQDDNEITRVSVRFADINMKNWQ